MKVSLLCLMLFLPYTLRAEVLSAKNIKEMSFNSLQKLRYAHIEFLMKLEQDERMGNFPVSSKKTSFFQQFWDDLLIKNAYARAADGSLCFFGGWASRMSGGKCAAPWRFKNDKEVKALGAYTPEMACGSETKFRCPSSLFGSPTNDGKGICIDTDGTYTHLTEKCERHSRAFVPKIIESYQANPEPLMEMMGEVKTFCDSFRDYDGCDDLSRRVKEITGAEQGEYEGKGGRSKNVDVQGEHLRPGADFPDGGPQIGAEVLGACEQLMNDPKNEIMSSLDKKDCSDSLWERFSSLDDFQEIAKAVEVQDIVGNVNVKAFELNTIALLTNEVRFGTIPDFRDKDALFETLTEGLTHLRDDPRFKESFLRAYDDMDREARAGRLYPFEVGSTAEQFNNLTSFANNACTQIRERYVEKFGEPGFFARWKDKKTHQAFFEEERQKVESELDTLLNESVAGHLLTTNVFKKNVFDSKSPFIEECARNPSYQVVKNPIAPETIQEAHQETVKLFQENFKTINQRQKTLVSSGVNQAKELLQNYLLTDPSIVNMSMEGLGENEQYQLGILICNEANNLKSNGKFSREHLKRLGLGTVLMANPVLAPIGGRMVAGSIVELPFPGLGLIKKYKISGQSEKAADLALTQRRQNMEKHLARSKAARDGKRDALMKGGLMALSIFPPISLATNAILYDKK